MGQQPRIFCRFSEISVQQEMLFILHLHGLLQSYPGKLFDLLLFIVGVVN